MLTRASSSTQSSSKSSKLSNPSKPHEPIPSHYQQHQQLNKPPLSAQRRWHSVKKPQTASKASKASKAASKQLVTATVSNGFAQWKPADWDSAGYSNKNFSKPRQKIFVGQLSELQSKFDTSQLANKTTVTQQSFMDAVVKSSLPLEFTQALQSPFPPSTSFEEIVKELGGTSVLRPIFTTKLEFQPIFSTSLNSALKPLNSEPLHSDVVAAMGAHIFDVPSLVKQLKFCELSSQQISRTIGKLYPKAVYSAHKELIDCVQQSRAPSSFYQSSYNIEILNVNESSIDPIAQQLLSSFKHHDSLPIHTVFQRISTLMHNPQVSSLVDTAYNKFQKELKRSSNVWETDFLSELFSNQGLDQFVDVFERNLDFTAAGRGSNSGKGAKHMFDNKVLPKNLQILTFSHCFLITGLYVALETWMKNNGFTLPQRSLFTDSDSDSQYKMKILKLFLGASDTPVSLNFDPRSPDAVKNKLKASDQSLHDIMSYVFSLVGPAGFGKSEILNILIALCIHFNISFSFIPSAEGTTSVYQWDCKNTKQIKLYSQKKSKDELNGEQIEKMFTYIDANWTGPMVVLLDPVESILDPLSNYKSLTEYFFKKQAQNKNRFFVSFHSLPNNLPPLPNQAKEIPFDSFSPIYLPFSPSHASMQTLFTKILQTIPPSVDSSSTISSNQRLHLLTNYASLFAAPTIRGYSTFLDFKPAYLSRLFSGSFRFKHASNSLLPLSRCTILPKNNTTLFPHNVDLSFLHYLSSNLTNFYCNSEIQQHPALALLAHLSPTNPVTALQINPVTALQIKTRLLAGEFFNKIQSSGQVYLPILNRTAQKETYDTQNLRTPFNLAQCFLGVLKSDANHIDNFLTVNDVSFETVSKVLASKIGNIWKDVGHHGQVYMFRMPPGFPAFNFLFAHVYKHTTPKGITSTELHLNFSQVSISNPSSKSNIPKLGYQKEAGYLVELIKYHIEGGVKPIKPAQPLSQPRSPPSKSKPTLPPTSNQIDLFSNVCRYGVIYHQPYLSNSTTIQYSHSSDYLHIPFCNWLYLASCDGPNCDDPNLKIDKFIQDYPFFPKENIDDKQVDS